jgi:hypothetical protein
MDNNWKEPWWNMSRFDVYATLVVVRFVQTLFFVWLRCGLIEESIQTSEYQVIVLTKNILRTFSRVYIEYAVFLEESAYLNNTHLVVV